MRHSNDTNADTDNDGMGNQKGNKIPMIWTKLQKKRCFRQELKTVKNCLFSEILKNT